MKKILFLVNRDFVLYNFRLELVSVLLEKGYEVFICLPYGPKVDEMISMGCQFIPIEIDTRGTDPLNDLKLIKQYTKVFRQVKPDIILMYTTKVVIYGGIVAGWMKIPYLLNVSGLGTAVEQKNRLQTLIIFLYRMALKKASCVFFQNEQNIAFFKEHRIECARKKLIPGSGVNLERWHPMEYPTATNGLHFLFIARIIKEKGIEQYLAAAESIKKDYPDAVFHILGPCDGEYEEIIEDSQKREVVKYHGMVQDTRPYLEKAHCTVHPSFYPEGISNVLLESAACCRPVITTDRPGCRETVDDGVTGYLTEERNSEDLIRAIRRFIALPWEEKRKMGLAGRKKVQREFDRNMVTLSYLKEIEHEVHF